MFFRNSELTHIPKVKLPTKWEFLQLKTHFCPLLHCRSLWTLFLLFMYLFFILYCIYSFIHLLFLHVGVYVFVSASSKEALFHSVVSIVLRYSIFEEIHTDFQESLKTFTQKHCAALRTAILCPKRFHFRCLKRYRANLKRFRFRSLNTASKKQATASTKL